MRKVSTQFYCDPLRKTISCSCRKFETFGILCCHAVKVFDLLDIKIIPDIYILKRWTRNAKNGYVSGSRMINDGGDANLNVV